MAALRAKWNGSKADIGPLDRPLQQRPETLNPIRMVRPIDVLASAVAHDAMIECTAKVAVAAAFVGRSEVASGDTTA